MSLFLYPLRGESGDILFARKRVDGKVNYLFLVIISTELHCCHASQRKSSSLKMGAWL